ncbi:MAG: hypothetical protein CL912_21570 [Deltaproteobacteria bacterium]|nr:hypothetical protein [Deltaproteobacteria bacterium]
MSALSNSAIFVCSEAATSGSPMNFKLTVESGHAHHAAKYSPVGAVSGLTSYPTTLRWLVPSSTL